MNWMPLKSVRIQNYKAIQDSGTINFSPFTLLIGKNGSGKSSLIEALEALRGLGITTVDEVFLGPKAIEHVVNKFPKKHGRVSPVIGLARSSERLKINGVGRLYSNTVFDDYATSIDRETKGIEFTFATELASIENGNGLAITKESVRTHAKWNASRNEKSFIELVVGRDTKNTKTWKLPSSQSMLRYGLENYFSSWQVLALVPELMGLPAPRRTSQIGTQIDRDGSNIAAILSHIAATPEYASVFGSIVDTLGSILGYADRFDARQDQGAIRSRYIELDEGKFTVPGWMMSTGSLRIIGLLLALRCARRPTVVLIEEIENGLDPAALGLLIDEINFLTRSKKIQVIATTHSPHLLDQVALDQVLFVQRREGVPHFLKPSESAHVEGFRDHFSPGRLYTMGVLSEAARTLK